MRIRLRPPNASFFSKFGKKETIVEGPYEEQWFDSIEKWQWKSSQQRRKLLAEKKEVTKITEEIRHNKEEWLEREPFDSEIYGEVF